jgi:hypothetical protein
MVVIKMVKKVPDLIPQLQPCVQKLLNNNAHSVVMSGLEMVIQIIKTDKSQIKTWTKFAPAFVKILNNLNQPTKFLNDASNPFLQVKVLEILGLLKTSSVEQDTILTSIINSVDKNRSEGRAVLLQTVQTVVITSKDKGHRSLALNSIARLLSFRDSNILYSVLCVLSNVLNESNEGGKADHNALQRYKSAVVHCLDNPDISVRRRALDVISGLTDANNVELLVPEILKYLHLADAEFRTEIVGRIFSSIQKFSPSEQWTFDSIVLMLNESGGYVKSDIISTTCDLVLNSKTMHQYAVQNLHKFFSNGSSSQPLIQVGSWIYGEYGESKQELNDLLSQLLILPQTTNETKGYILTALAKIAARASENKQILETIQASTINNDLEIHQRAIEYLHLLPETEYSSAVLAPFPPKNVDLTSEAVSQTSAPTTTIPTPSTPTAITTPTVISSPSQSLASDLLQLLDATPSLQLSIGPIEIYQKNGIVASLEAKRYQSNLNQISVQTKVYNNSTFDISNLNIEYTPSEGWTCKHEPLSLTNILKGSQVPAAQISYWLNKGSLPLTLKFDISYISNTQQFNDTRQIPLNF